MSGALCAAQTPGCAPEQFWVNYMNAPDEMAVSWATACDAPSTVQYGLSPNALTFTEMGGSSQYTFAASGYVSPYLHHALLENLPTNTQYFYRVGSDESGWSPVFNFTSHPGVGPDMPMLFGLIGDLGQTVNSQSTLQHVIANPNIHAIVHAGDLSYADEVEERWDSWGRMVAPLACHKPWMVTVGNHEVEIDVNLKTFEAYMARYAMPLLYPFSPNATRSQYYSFRAGAVHWLMLSSYTDYTPGSAQYKWLEWELANNVDRSQTPWLIAVLHAPWYNSNHAHQGEGEPMRLSMEQMFHTAGVDMVFSGHVHSYERIKRIYDNALDASGPYFINIGDGGNREGLAMNWLSPQPEWSAFRQSSYGHGELQIVNSTHAHWSWHQNPDLEPVVADELWIVRGGDTDHMRDEKPRTGQVRFRAGVKALRGSN